MHVGAIAVTVGERGDIDEEEETGSELSQRAQRRRHYVSSLEGHLTGRVVYAPCDAGEQDSGAAALGCEVVVCVLTSAPEV